MTPISLGIFASATNVASTSFESIATVTVGSGGATSAEFTSIPATYSHLQVRLLARDTRNASGDNFSIQFNSDTTAANYVSYHWILGDGSTVTAGALAAGVQGQIVIGEVSTAQTSASIFSAGVFDILDYANTNKYKTVRSLSGADNNSVYGKAILYSGLWMNTNAVTSIVLKSRNAGYNIAQYSHFALYGIRSA